MSAGRGRFPDGWHVPFISHRSAAIRPLGLLESTRRGGSMLHGLSATESEPKVGRISG